MKITIVQGAFLPVPPLRGGAIEKRFYALGREFARRGHTVTHVSRSFDGLPDRESRDGVEYMRVPGSDTPQSGLILKMMDLAYSLRALRALPEADILVTNTFWLPALVRTRKFGAVYVDVARFPKGQMGLYRHAARLQAVSKAIAEAIMAQSPACAKIVKVVPNTMAENWIKPELDDARPMTGNLLYVGRVHPEKGLDLLVEAVAELRRRGRSGVKLTVVGPADTSAGGGGAAYLECLKALAAPIAESVEWVGPVYDNAVLKQYYDEASLFVYPSVAELGESFGVSPLEAMARGCVPVVSSLACFQEYLEPGVNGLVFDHRAAKASICLANAIEEGLDLGGRYEAMRRRGYETARRFTVERIADLFLDDFRSLLA